MTTPALTLLLLLALPASGFASPSPEWWRCVDPKIPGPTPVTALRGGGEHQSRGAISLDGRAFFTGFKIHPSSRRWFWTLDDTAYLFVIFHNRRGAFYYTSFPPDTDGPITPKHWYDCVPFGDRTPQERRLHRLTELQDRIQQVLGRLR